MLIRVILGLGFSVVSDAERYPGGNGIILSDVTLCHIVTLSWLYSHG